MKVTLNLHNAKTAERQKPSFPKESVENADLYKPVLSKIMTRLEQSMKYNFATPLMHKIKNKKFSAYLPKTIWCATSRLS